MPVSRRRFLGRFLAISASLTLAPAMGRAERARHYWTGQALGARASIRIDHPEAEAIVARCLSEIDRLENILSLYRANSALSKLNRDGELEAPPFELLDCLALSGAVYRSSGGLFDPTVQPLWALWAEAAVAGHRPSPEARRTALSRVGWEGVRFDNARITLPRNAALTLNGIGQGYVADRVAGLLKNEGLSHILIDTGEFRALEGQPDGAPWPVRLAGGGMVPLEQRALATSSPLGTTFDSAGRDGHILDPRKGAPVQSSWREITITAPSAALADALSTAACLMEKRAGIDRMLAHHPDARLESALAV